jgi:L-glyceraldehyde 3-phosphate reductase
MAYRKDMPFVADPTRYDHMEYRRCGRRGLKLPAISLGLWQNFGDTRPADEIALMLTRAFDLGVTHFDLANNYGPAAGAAETNFGEVMAGPLAPYRDELVVSTKAGYDMGPGPYGDGGSRKYMLASLDASLRRMQLDYVDIFYSHRFDPETPLEETMGALATAVHQGKALYPGISNYPPDQTGQAAAILSRLGTPLLIHQPAYSMLNRWMEQGLLDAIGEAGAGCIVYSPLEQGILTDRYLQGVPAGSRASQEETLSRFQLDEATLAKVRALEAIARRRGQTMAQLALAWTQRDPRVTSTLVGASSLTQLEQNVATIDGLGFSSGEAEEIDDVLSD